MLHCAAVQAVNLPCKKSCLSNPTRGLCTRRHINVISKSLSLLREDGTAELQTAILSQINLYGRNPLIFPFAAFCFTLIDQLNTEKGDRLVKKKWMLLQKLNTYHQTFYVWKQRYSAIHDSFHRRDSQSLVYSVGQICPPFPGCNT